MVAFAPSTRIFLPLSYASFTYSNVSAMNGSMRAAISLYRSISASTSYSNPSNLAAASCGLVASPVVNFSSLRMSPKRIPLRVAFDAYADRFLSSSYQSYYRSTPPRASRQSPCEDQTTSARDRTQSFSSGAHPPAFNNASISSNIPGRCTTTPFPTTHVAFLFKIPLGTKCNAYFFPVVVMPSCVRRSPRPDTSPRRRTLSPDVH